MALFRVISAHQLISRAPVSFGEPFEGPRISSQMCGHSNVGTTSTLKIPKHTNNTPVLPICLGWRTIAILVNRYPANVSGKKLKKEAKRIVMG